MANGVDICNALQELIICVSYDLSNLNLAIWILDVNTGAVTIIDLVNVWL